MPHDVLALTYVNVHIGEETGHREETVLQFTSPIFLLASNTNLKGDSISIGKDGFKLQKEHQ